MAAKKKAAKKTAAKAVKKTAAKAVKKAAKKKAAPKAAKAPKKAAAKKVATKKVAAKKVAAKKVAAKKVAAKKAPAKKAPSKKAPAKKAAAKKAPAKKAAVKKVAAEKPAPPKKVAPPKPVKLTIFVKKQRQNLLDLRDELMDVMYGVKHDTLLNSPEGSEASGSGMHQGDAGSDAYDRDFALNLLSKEQNALQAIEAALERISIGTYGICEISGKKIPQARLEAIPFARLTVECQTKWEQEHPHQQFLGIPRGSIAGNGTSAVSLDEAV